MSSRRDSRHADGDGRGNSSPYDVFEDRDSQCLKHKVREDSERSKTRERDVREDSERSKTRERDVREDSERSKTRERDVREDSERSKNRERDRDRGKDRDRRHRDYPERSGRDREDDGRSRNHDYNRSILGFSGAMIMIVIERGITDTDHIPCHLTDPENLLDLALKAYALSLVLYAEATCKNKACFVSDPSQSFIPMLAKLRYVCPFLDGERTHSPNSTT